MTKQIKLPVWANKPKGHGKDTRVIVTDNGWEIVYPNGNSEVLRSYPGMLDRVAGLNKELSERGQFFNIETGQIENTGEMEHLLKDLDDEMSEGRDDGSFGVDRTIPDNCMTVGDMIQKHIDSGLTTREELDQVKEKMELSSEPKLEPKTEPKEKVKYNKDGSIRKKPGRKPKNKID